ncbi:alpha/beta fold hydrolase [Mucilaginibacter endophyticus]|uniref:alpha/beta fold hydrolase n=1 Tax=Mucilaginibacter endophyticus TaxID=2675003 RepID=UPI000E0DD6C7|nr:alpha/beta hydrolase [Mucilaginibacter endophyticus]
MGKIDQKSCFIEVETGVHLHVIEAGNGRPVMLLHGWPLSNEVFKHQYKALSEQNYPAIGVSLRGFGKSSKADSEYSYEMHVNDIHNLINILDIDNVVLLGFSFGSSVAASYIAKYQPSRVTGLALLAVNVPLAVKLPDHAFGFELNDLNTIIAALPDNRKSLTDIYGPLSKLTENDLSLNEANWINGVMAEASSDALIKSIIALKNLDLRHELSKIQIPTGIFHAKDDLTIPMEIALEAHEQISNSKLYMYETGGHYLLLTRKDQFNRDLIHFIQHA